MGEIKISLVMQKLVTVTCSLLDQKEIIRTEDKTCMTKKHLKIMHFSLFEKVYKISAQKVNQF